MKIFSPQIRDRFKLFLQLRRAKYSLYILVSLYVISLFANLIANNVPLLVSYRGELYFPLLKFYEAERFEQSGSIRPDYKKLKDDLKASDQEGFVLFPFIPYGHNESLWHIDVHPSPPTWKNLFGTDDRGRDVLTRLLYAFRISVTFALLLVCIGITSGTLIGAVQGYIGGMTDLSVQRITEIIAALPFLYIAIILGSFFGQSLILLLIILSFFNWIGISYYMRGEYLRLRQFYFVESSRALGMGRLRIMIREILPNALTPIITFLPFEMIGAIFTLTSLDFLGYGLPAPTPSWGELIRQALTYREAWWLVVFTFMALFITLLLMAFIGEGIREAFDPKRLNRIR